LRVDLIVTGTGRVGEPVPITIRLTNTSNQPIDAYFVGRQITYDIVVRRPDRAVVWRRPQGKAVQQMLQLRRFAPGEKLELTDVWRPQRAGRYAVEGVVLGQDQERLRARTAVVVEG
jgi:hypothetical protein